MPSLVSLYLHTHPKHPIPVFSLPHHTLGFPRPLLWSPGARRCGQSPGHGIFWAELKSKFCH